MRATSRRVWPSYRPNPSTPSAERVGRLHAVEPLPAAGPDGVGSGGVGSGGVCLGGVDTGSFRGAAVLDDPLAGRNGGEAVIPPGDIVFVSTYSIIWTPVLSLLPQLNHTHHG